MTIGLHFNGILHFEFAIDRFIIFVQLKDLIFGHIEFDQIGFVWIFLDHV